MEKDEIEFILSIINNARVFEYGSGGSTILFGEKAKEYYSVENDLGWYNSVKEEIKQKNLFNVKVFYKQISEHDQVDFKCLSADKRTDSYILTLKEAGGMFDIILVDGFKRRDCSLFAYDYLKDDGILLVHDAFAIFPKICKWDYENQGKSAEAAHKQFGSAALKNDKHFLVDERIYSNETFMGLKKLETFEFALKDEFHSLLSRYLLVGKTVGPASSLTIFKKKERAEITSDTEWWK